MIWDSSLLIFEILSKYLPPTRSYTLLQTYGFRFSYPIQITCKTLSIYPHQHYQDLTQVILSGAYQVLIQSTPSPRLVAIPRLLITRGRIVGFKAFLRILVLCKIQSSSRIWNRVALSIFDGNNNYISLKPLYFQICYQICYNKLNGFK